MADKYPTHKTNPFTKDLIDEILKDTLVVLNKKARKFIDKIVNDLVKEIKINKNQLTKEVSDNNEKYYLIDSTQNKKLVLDVTVWYEYVPSGNGIGINANIK